MDRDGLTALALARGDRWSRVPHKRQPDPSPAAGPGFRDFARCAFSCWLQGSNFERVDVSRDAFVCICSKREPIAGGLWRWR